MAAAPRSDDRAGRPGGNPRRRSRALLIAILVLGFVIVFGYLLLVGQVGD